jgi:hypothetical protein
MMRLVVSRSRRTTMKRRILLVLPVALILALFAFAIFHAPAEAQPGKRWHMHIAIEELRGARKELKEASHNFGGHREKAILAIDEAILQIEKAIPFIK